MMDIYSGDRGKINAEITDFLNEKLGEEYGIEVILASISICRRSSSVRDAEMVLLALASASA